MGISTKSTKYITVEELLRLPDDGFRYELVKGELRKMPPAGFEHGVLAIRIGSRLDQHVRLHDLGLVIAAETGFKLASNPDTVRAPDAGFVKKERLPAELPKGYFPGAPDLAVEVISPDDTLVEVEEKIFDWFASGAKMVWVINPRHKTVKVYSSFTQVKVLVENDELNGEDLLPGFRYRISEIFV